MPNQRRASIFSLVFFLLSLALAVGVGELYVRMRGHYDADGTFYFRDKPVRPYALPVAQAKRLIDQYNANPNGFMMYDPQLGWTNRPRACTDDHLYCVNAYGLRSNDDYTAAMRPGTYRVIWTGDSFMFGFNAGLEDSPARQVERLLKERGKNAEVLDFAVGGYGFDQAYLRYARDAARFDASVVVQGLQMENLTRDLTLFRIVAFPGTGIPFAKPRFLLRNGALQLIDDPTPAPEDVAKTLRNFDRWPLARYELYYGSKYQRRWFAPSKLICTLVDGFIAKKEAADAARTASALGPYGESTNVTVALLERYRDEVTRSGKPFFLVYLPLQDTITSVMNGQPDPWQAHLKRLSGFNIIDPTPRLVAYAKQHGVGSLFNGHYSPAGYRLVAEAVADALAPAQN
jgi:hypothetical protein